LRADIEQFNQAGAQVVAVGPDDAEGVARFVRDNDYPFPLLADPDHAVFDAYDVINKLASLGQRPALFVVDQTGVVRFDSIGKQQWQIPSNENVLMVLSSLADA
jgi:thioredoxin-dependent peroxiredoxin